RAIMHVLTTASPRHRGPEIIEHVPVETDALARRKTDNPDARTLVFRQQRGANTRVGILALTLELGGNIGRPLRRFLFLGRLVEHSQSHGKFLQSCCLSYIG